MSAAKASSPQKTFFNSLTHSGKWILKWYMDDVTNSLSDKIGNDEELIEYISSLEKYFFIKKSKIVEQYDRYLDNLREIRESVLNCSENLPEIPKVNPPDLPKVKHQKMAIYFRCTRCNQICYMTQNGIPHNCHEYAANSLDEQDLNYAHGVGNWEVIGKLDPSVSSRTLDEMAKGVRAGRGEVVEAAPASDNAVEVKPVQFKPDALFLPRAHGLRPGARREKVYQFLRKLNVTSAPMHVDEILEKIRLLDEFQGMKRTTLFNILSKLKSKNLLLSDNRGYWRVK